MVPSDAAVVLVPLKSFGSAKSRLGDLLDPAQRSALVRSMAEVVLAAASPLRTVVVCDDDEVADFARNLGAAVVSTPPDGLNESLQRAVERAAAAGVRRVMVVPGDLPFASDLARFADPADDGVLMVADRHGEGTNLLSFAPASGFRLQYGPGSFDAHSVEARRLGLALRVVEDEAIAWDVDEPEDLSPPTSLGSLPEWLPDVETCRHP